MVRAVLLGTGSPPPNPKRRGPATLLSLDDERFLVDAGSGVGVQLVHECCEMSKTSGYPGCGWPTVEDKVQDLTSYHTQPDQIGSVAKASRAKGLVMTHLMPGSDPAELRAAARARYAGPVVVGEDLMEV